MSQLCLNIQPKLTYSTDNFLLHEGVRKVLEDCLALVQEPHFQLVLIHGAKGSGRTHLSIKLGEQLASSGVEVVFMDGSVRDLPDASAPVVVMDNADAYLSALAPGGSGEFVSLVEEVRNRNGAILLLGACPISELQADEHILSRIRSGVELGVGDPAGSEIEELISIMAAQRGLDLGMRKTRYLTARLPRSVAAIADYLDNLDTVSMMLGKKAKFDLLGDLL